MFDRWNEDAIRILMRAQEEGRRMGHAFIGTEQFLLGLVADGSRNLASQFLKEKGFTIEATRASIQKIIGRGMSDNFVLMPFTPRMKKVIELAGESADKFKDEKVGPEHLLLALFLEADGVAMHSMEPSLRLKLHMEFSTLLATVKKLGNAVLTAKRPEFLGDTKALSRDINDVLEGLVETTSKLAEAGKLFEESISGLAKAIEEDNQQHPVWVIRGTEIRRYIVNDEEKANWTTSGIRYFESEYEANETLLAELGTRIGEITNTLINARRGITSGS